MVGDYRMKHEHYRSIRQEPKGAQAVDGGSRGKYWQMRRSFCMGMGVHRYLTIRLRLGTLQDTYAVSIRKVASSTFQK
jgi:hypothetical protein